MSEPSNAVLALLGAVVVVGGGRRLFQAWAARRDVAQIETSDPTPAQIEAVGRHRRAGLYPLFRLLIEARSEESRLAAGRVLARLWKADELIEEEEKALLQRGFQANWIARRRYPRALRAELPFVVEFDVPFLVEAADTIGPQNIEWSFRILGAGRASLEKPSPWTPGPCRAAFEIVPGDFANNGPHRLVLEARARPVGTSSSWEVALPQVPFSFEFDPRLAIDSLLASPDAHRAEAVGQQITLTASPEPDRAEPRFFEVAGGLALRDPPALRVARTFPCDLAASLELEVENTTPRLPFGSLVVVSQGSDSRTSGVELLRPLEPPAPIPVGYFHQPGRARVRVHLIPNAELGWGNPAVRSIWPEPVVTNWCEVEVVRN